MSESSQIYPNLTHFRKMEIRWVAQSSVWCVFLDFFPASLSSCLNVMNRGKQEIEVHGSACPVPPWSSTFSLRGEIPIRIRKGLGMNMDHSDVPFPSFLPRQPVFIPLLISSNILYFWLVSILRKVNTHCNTFVISLALYSCLPYFIFLLLTSILWALLYAENNEDIENIKVW